MIPKALSEGEETLALHLGIEKIPFQREVKLIPGSRMRWDFVVEDLAIEVHGGTWHFGGHTSGYGVQRDSKKVNAATLAGYRTLVFTTDMVKSGEAIAVILNALQRTGTHECASAS